MPDAGLMSGLRRELHVWFADTGTISAEQMADQYLPLLDQEEHERYQRFHFDRDRLVYLAAHALVRMTLSRYAPCAPEQWQFVQGAQGKPEIVQAADLPPLRFNLSHTQGMVACVVALERDCGVDVENIRPMTDMRSMATMVFSDKEISYLESITEEAWPKNFFSLWTLKEAYIKAIGLGFSAPLKQITFDIASPEITVHLASEPGDDAAMWQLQSFSPNGVHQLAVASKKNGSGDDIVFRQLDLTSKQYKQIAPISF